MRRTLKKELKMGFELETSSIKFLIEGDQEINESIASYKPGNKERRRIETDTLN